MPIDNIASMSNYSNILTTNTKRVDSQPISKTSETSKKDMFELMQQVNGEPQNVDTASFGSEKAEMFSNMARSEELARKYARGEPLTDEEMKFLEKNNPELLGQARNAKKQAEFIKHQMEAAETKQQAQMVAMSARGMALSMSKYSPGQAMVYMEAINKAIKDYNDGKQEDVGSDTVIGSVPLQNFGAKNPANPLADIVATPPVAVPAPAPTPEGSNK